MSTQANKPMHMSGRATGHDLKTRFALDRYPISLTPGSATRINQERLPEPQQLAGMELAYRQEFVSEGEAKSLATEHCVLMLVMQIAFAFLFPLLAVLLPISFGLGLVGTIAAGIILNQAARLRRLTLRTIVLAFAIPLVGLLFFHVASFLTVRRMLGTVILGVGSLYLLHRIGSRPGSFYFDWIYTYAPLRPEDRRNRKQVKRGPNLALFAFILAVAAFVPWLSLTLAIAIIVIVCAYWCRDYRYGIQLLPKALEIVGQYFMYGEPGFAGPGVADFDYYDAPGVWIPEHSGRRRRNTTYAITAAIYIPLTLGLCYFIPYEFISGPLYDTFETHVLSRSGVRDFPHIDPTFQKEDLPQTLQQFLKEPPSEEPSSGYYTPPRPDPKPSFEARQAAGKDYIVSLISNRPQVAPWLAVNGIADGRTAFGWLLPLALLIGIPLNTLVLLAVYRESIDDLTFLRKSIEESAAKDTRPEWEWYVDRIKDSPHVATEPLGREVREAEHLFLGVEPFFRFPILLDRKILDEHAYIVGETGSGKTALGIMPLLIQLIRGHTTGKPQTANVDIPPEQQSRSLPPPIVIIDLKGDPALFNTVKEESETRRKEMGITDPKDPRFAFRFFSLEKDRPTHFFNPFASLESASCTLIQLCHLILDSLNLSHGEGYGRGYYSRKNRHLLLEALEKLPPESRSFDDLYPIIRQLARTQQHRDCFELVSTIHALTKYPQVASFLPLKQPADAIHMPSVIEHSQVVYFWLPAALESITVREVGKLALFCLLTAAIDRQRQRRNEAGPRQSYLVIDEFQRIAGENLKVILEQARSFGISVIMANQSMYDLYTHDIDLRPTVMTNTRFKQFFALGDRHDVEDLKEMSGEEIATLHSWTTAGESWSNNELPRILPRRSIRQKSESEFIKSRLMVNDILAASDHPLHSIIHVLRGSGYTQYAGLPIPLCSTWPMHESEYRRRQHEPWPGEVGPYELDTVVPKKSPQENELEAAQEAARERAIIDERIRELLPDEPEA